MAGGKERPQNEPDPQRGRQFSQTVCPNHTQAAALVPLVPHNGVEKVLGPEASTHFTRVSLDLVIPGLGAGAGDNRPATCSPPSGPPLLFIGKDSV